MWLSRDPRHFYAGIYFGGESVEVVKRIRAGKTAIDEEDAVEHEGDGDDGTAEPRTNSSVDAHYAPLPDFVACWLLIVVHTWLSVRFPGFAVPAGIAFAAVLAGYLMLSANPRAFGWWYPWTLAISVRPEGLYEAHYPMLPVLVGGLGGLLLAPVAAWDLGRRID